MSRVTQTASWVSISHATDEEGGLSLPWVNRVLSQVCSSLCGDRMPPYWFNKEDDTNPHPVDTGMRRSLPDTEEVAMLRTYSEGTGFHMSFNSSCKLTHLSGEWGAVLTQCNNIGAKHSVAYFGWKLLCCMEKYSAIKKCLVVKLACHAFRVYLLGRPFTKDWPLCTGMDEQAEREQHSPDALEPDTTTFPVWGATLCRPWEWQYWCTILCPIRWWNVRQDDAVTAEEGGGDVKDSQY